MATVQQYLTDWLTLRSLTLKPRTVESYRGLFRRYVFPALGGADLAALSPIDLAHLLAAIVSDGHTRTAELLYTVLNAAFKLLPENPLHGVPRPRHTQESPPVWDDEQIAAYIAALSGHKHQLGLSLGIMLGLRRGEICGLRWEDIDFKDNLIFIHRQLVRLDSGDLIECDPKSKTSTRVLPIPNGLSALLRASRQLSGRLCPLTLQVSTRLTGPFWPVWSCPTQRCTASGTPSRPPVSAMEAP